MTTMTLIVVAALAVAVSSLAGAYRNVKRRELLHRERMAAIERGTDVDARLLETLQQEDRPPGSSNLTLHGLIWTAIGAGLFVGSYLARPSHMTPSFERLYAMNMASVRIWAYPALAVGITLLIYGALRRRSKPGGGHEDGSA